MTKFFKFFVACAVGLLTLFSCTKEEPATSSPDNLVVGSWCTTGIKLYFDGKTLLDQNVKEKDALYMSFYEDNTMHYSYGYPYKQIFTSYLREGDILYLFERPLHIDELTDDRMVLTSLLESVPVSSVPEEEWERKGTYMGHEVWTFPNWNNQLVYKKGDQFIFFYDYYIDNDNSLTADSLTYIFKRMD